MYSSASKEVTIAGCWWLMLVSLATQEAEIRRIEVESQSGQIVLETLSQKYLTQNRAGRVAQVLKYLAIKCEALSSNPRTTKKKKKNQR
jgi:hypothetical protein